jgi:hypothetical protein
MSSPANTKTSTTTTTTTTTTPTTDGIDHLAIGECVCLIVGMLILVFSEMVLGRKLTIPKKVSNFKALREISFKESHLNVAMNTNALSCTLVGIMFIIFSCLIEFFKNLRVATELAVDSMRIIELIMGVCMFTTVLLVVFNILQEKTAFERIVHNNVGKNYTTAMLTLTGFLTLYSLGFAFIFYRSDSEAKKVLDQSYLQFFIGSIIVAITVLLYKEIYRPATDG